MVKGYLTIWAIYLGLAALVFLTGNMSMIVLVAFGFVCFGLIFAGMMMVLPSTVAHANHHGEPVRKVKIVKERDFVPTGAVHVR